MMIEKLKKLNIIKGNGCINSNYNYIFNKFPNIKNKIWKKTSFLVNNVTLTERIYCITYDIITPVKCYCGKLVKFHGTTHGYSKYCCTKCSNASLLKTKKIKKTWKNKSQEEIDNRTQKHKQTKLERYSNENYNNKEKQKQTRDNKSQEEKNKIIQKYKQTCQQRYSRSNPNQQYISIDSLDKLNDKEWLKEQHYVKQKPLTEIAIELDAHLYNQGWLNERIFKNNPELINKSAHLYIIHCYNETESFIKVGVTKNSIKQRYAGFKYVYEILLDIELPYRCAWRAEQDILNQFREYSYKPLIEFNGHTECLNESSYENIIEYIK